MTPVFYIDGVDTHLASQQRLNKLAVNNQQLYASSTSALSTEKKFLRRFSFFLQLKRKLRVAKSSAENKRKRRERKRRNNCGSINWAEEAVDG